MKKSITLWVGILLTLTSYAQAPEKMSYQAVVRDASNNLVVNTTIGMQSSILQGSATGTEVYVETQNPMTNENGLISVEVGAGAAQTGVFADIDWENGPYFLKTEFDIAGGTNYTIEGTSQLLSVPYALHAKTVEEKQSLELNGNDLTISDGNTITLPNSVGGNQNKVWVILTGDINDAEAATKLANEVGDATRFIRVSSTTQLTTIDMTGFPQNELIELKIEDNEQLTTVIIPETVATFEELRVINNPNLQTFSMNGLELAQGRTLDQTGLIIRQNPLLSTIEFSSLIAVQNGILSIRDCDFVSAFDFNNLEHVEIFRIENSEFLSLELNSLQEAQSIHFNSVTLQTNLVLPDLVHVDGGIDFSNCNNSSLQLPSLEFSISIVIGNSNDFTSFSAPQLNSCVSFEFASTPNLNSVELTSLADLGDFVLFDCNCTNLNVLELPSLSNILYTGGNWFYLSAGLNSNSVNSILASLVNVLNNGNLSYLVVALEQTPEAPPTGQGILDKQTLLNSSANLILTTD